MSFHINVFIENKMTEYTKRLNTSNITPVYDSRHYSFKNNVINTRHYSGMFFMFSIISWNIL